MKEKFLVAYLICKFQKGKKKEKWIYLFIRLTFFTPTISSKGKSTSIFPPTTLSVLNFKCVDMMMSFPSRPLYAHLNAIAIPKTENKSMLVSNTKLSNDIVN